jgi:hypothetical protein
VPRDIIRRVFLVVALLLLLVLAWTGLDGGVSLFMASQSPGQKAQAIAQIAFALVSLVTAGTRGLTVAGLMILMACQPHTAAKPPAPVRDSVVSRVIVRSDTISDTLLLRAMHEAQAQSARAAAQVDTIVVQPDTVRLHVGETVPLYPTVKIEARDKRGAAVPHFAPALSLGDRGIADFSGWALTGRRPGLTWLVVSPLSADPTIKVKATKAMLWIQVEP